MRLALCLIAVLAGACDGRGARLPEYELSGQSMGTTYSVKIVAPERGLDRAALGKLIAGRLDEIEQRLSTYIEDSELSRFNASNSTDWIDVSTEMCRLVQRAHEISVRTGGAFDITVGPLVNLWGFGPTGDALEPPPADAVAAARQVVGYEKVQADCSVPALRKDAPGVYLDLSAYAKGYAVDRVAELVEEHPLAGYLVEIGGELRIKGVNARREPWAVAIEKPDDGTRAVQSILAISDSGMATSGDYRNFYLFNGQRYSHTIDPRSGHPVNHAAAAVTVVEPSAAEADALATALLVLGPDEGMAFAAKESLAALFLVRTGTGIDELATERFAQLMKRNQP